MSAACPRARSVCTDCLAVRIACRPSMPPPPQRDARACVSRGTSIPFEKISRRSEQRRMAGAKDHRGGSVEARGCSAGHSGGQRGERFERQCAKAQKKRLGHSGVAAMNRSFTQVRHQYLRLGKSYLKITQDLLNQLGYSLLESPCVPWYERFCEDALPYKSAD
ncbi:hypothetical protein OAO87_00670 [bacterium]|nr:hypothetical protein [bacterium]